MFVPIELSPDIRSKARELDSYVRLMFLINLFVEPLGGV
jgi:hypothetical protein